MLILASAFFNGCRNTKTKAITSGQSQPNIVNQSENESETLCHAQKNMQPMPSAANHSANVKRGKSCRNTKREKTRVSQTTIVWFCSDLLIKKRVCCNWSDHIFRENFRAHQPRAKPTCTPLDNRLFTAGIRLHLQLRIYTLFIFKFRFPGRAIRHRGDYATILLLDQRYGSARIQRSLPGWISNRLQHQARFGSAFAAIRKVNCCGVGCRCD